MGDAPPEITGDQEVRVPCVCQKCNNTWMSGMETTVKKFLGSMIDDFSLPLDRQYQQNLTEWAVKCAMCNDTVDPHPRFFTEAKRDFVKKMHSANAEGFVCKNRNAAYAGGRAGQHFKCKFVVTASFIVGPKPEKKANDGHRSIAVYLLDDNRQRFKIGRAHV